jgi:(2Fe-2S) ferredoxin
MSTTTGKPEQRQGQTEPRQTQGQSEEKWKEFDTFYTHADLPKRRDGRNLQLWKTVANREVAKEDWAEIIQAYRQGTKPPELSGFIDGAGQEFSAPLEIWNTAGGIHADFSPRMEGIKIPTAKCPVTGEPLVKRTTKNGHAYFQAKGFPGLVMYEEIHGRKVAPHEVVKILTAALDGNVGPEMMVKSKEGQPYPLSLKVVQNEKGRWEFEEHRTIKKIPTETICPISNTPILETKNCWYSEAYPDLRFPKHYWGRDFLPEDVAAVVEAHHNGAEAPEFELVHRDGTTYSAKIGLTEDGRYLKLDYLNQRQARTEGRQLDPREINQTPAAGRLGISQ